MGFSLGVRVFGRKLSTAVSSIGSRLGNSSGFCTGGLQLTLNHFPQAKSQTQGGFKNGECGDQFCQNRGENWSVIFRGISRLARPAIGDRVAGSRKSDEPHDANPRIRGVSIGVMCGITQLISCQMLRRPLSSFTGSLSSLQTGQNVTSEH
jgi:hypothetical protein